jgi:hypothetical protein
MNAEFRPLLVTKDNGEIVETEAGTIYVFEDGDLEHHDPYAWSCTAVFCREVSTVEIYGVSKTVTIPIKNAIADLLRKENISKVKWERWKNGVMRIAEYEIS